MVALRSCDPPTLTFGHQKSTARILKIAFSVRACRSHGRVLGTEAARALSGRDKGRSINRAGLKSESVQTIKLAFSTIAFICVQCRGRHSKTHGSVVQLHGLCHQSSTMSDNPHR